MSPGKGVGLAFEGAPWEVDGYWRAPPPRPRPLHPQSESGLGCGSAGPAAHLRRPGERHPGARPASGPARPPVAAQRARVPHPQASRPASPGFISRIPRPRLPPPGKAKRLKPSAVLLQKSVLRKRMRLTASSFQHPRS